MKRNMTMDSFDSPDATSPMSQSKQEKSWRSDAAVAPPEFVETKELSEVAVPPLGEKDEVASADSSKSASSGRSLAARSIKYIWQAGAMWVVLLAVSLSSSRVQEVAGDSFDMLRNSTLFTSLENPLSLDMLSLDTFFNSTMKPYFEKHLDRIRNQDKDNDRQRRPALSFVKQGAKPKYPIVMIPGFVTSGLELWEGHDCAKKYFRQKMWGALGTARSFFTETECWMKHLSLDTTTGLDPPGIRLRAAQGFEAADYFMTAYWVWNKLIDNLAEIGYDGSTMSMESYDWRLSYALLEQRDGYFTKLMHKIEAMHKTADEQVVIAAHSMGTPLMTYFFAWVVAPEHDGGGGGGHDWVDKHVHSLVNIAGPMLGVPKAIPSIMSGEMKDTAAMMGTFGSMVEGFCGRRRRKLLWGSWGSLWAMFPKGGVNIWGVGADICAEGTVADGLHCVPLKEGAEYAPSPFLSFTPDPKKANDTSECHNMKPDKPYLEDVISSHANNSNWTIDETLSFMGEWGAGQGPDHPGAKYSSLGQPEKEKVDWNDPTRTPLPYAPSMKIYCLYGVGLPTERSFFYKRNYENIEKNETKCTVSPPDLPFVMDGSIQSEKENIQYGARMVDGDASVPLLSLGLMCVDGWKKPHLNPSGSPVITREYKHQGEFSVDDPMRGGPKSAEHVDILGNMGMMGDFLRIVTDFETEKVQDQIVSDIENIADRINAHPLGGLQPEDSTATMILKTMKRTFT